MLHFETKFVTAGGRDMAALAANAARGAGLAKLRNAQGTNNAAKRHVTQTVRHVDASVHD